MSDQSFKTLGYNVKGHYTTSLFITLADTLAAGARLFSIRNASPAATPTLLIPTRLVLRAIQASAGTAQRAAITANRLTSFTASDSTNAVAQTAVVKSTRGDMAAAPGSAELFSYNGNTAGMTGGTLTRDGASFGVLPLVVSTAATPYLWEVDALDDPNGTHPFVLARNEGFDLENVFVNTTSFGMTLLADLSWAECVSFGQ